MEISTETHQERLRAFTLRNKNGVEMSVLNFGGIVTRLLVPDKRGVLADVLLGFENPEDYVRQTHPYLNALIGRVGNRICEGRFRLDQHDYMLSKNHGRHSLHGGLKGFDKAFWNVEEFKKENSIRLKHLSPDGDEGFPGNLQVTVNYTLTEDNEWKIEYEAKTDKPTPVNLTQHAYFNLAGDSRKSVLDHILAVDSDAITSVDDELIPTGDIAPVENTAFDFRKAHKIGDKIKLVPQGGGYDHNWVLNGTRGQLNHAATLFEIESGRQMDVYTTEPGLQFYSGNFLKGEVKGKGNIPYQRHAGLCLETQHFPDSVHQPHFPTTILRPGAIYRSTTIYKFSTLTT